MTKYQIIAELASFTILQGSRAHFNSVPLDSDWDFYCACTVDNKARLESLGFIRMENTSYMDDNTSAVYKYGKGITAIDVAIVKDLALKAKVEDWIGDHLWILKVPKCDRPMLYNMIMKSLQD